jgi:hypothetical protein
MAKWTEMEEESIAEAVNTRDGRIKRLMRNQELLKAFICSSLNQPTKQTLEEVRTYLGNNNGYNEEF